VGDPTRTTGGHAWESGPARYPNGLPDRVRIAAGPGRRSAHQRLTPSIGEDAAGCARTGDVLASDDEQLARMLVLMWSLASGRRLDPGVRPEQLSREELIAFWADDLVLASGRHARVPERAVTRP
jgi:hypothetical protein